MTIKAMTSEYRDRFVRPRGFWASPAIGLILLLLGSGCEMDNAEFIMRDRPFTTDMRGERKVTTYVVHVGDTPSLAFRSKLQFCDYAIMHDSGTEAFEDCGPDMGGSYEWPYTFTSVPPSGMTTLHVKAYKQAGKRDTMPYNGKVMELEIGNDPEDKVAAAAEIHVQVYQSRVVIPVDLGGKEALWHAARLEMDGQGVRKRRIQHSGVPRPGYFTVEGPDSVGRYSVIYEPSIRDIDPTGVTTALLMVPDEDARFHEFSVELRPPTIRPPTSMDDNMDGASDAGMTPVSLSPDCDELCRRPVGRLCLSTMPTIRCIGQAGGA